MATRTDVDDFDLDDDSDDYTDLEMDDDEDIFFDDEADGEEFEALDFTNRYRNFSARRRIEIAREDKWLQSVMADFEDFDSIGDPDDQQDWRSAY
jgi:hypothetical protein